MFQYNSRATPSLSPAEQAKAHDRGVPRTRAQAGWLCQVSRFLRGDGEVGISPLAYKVKDEVGTQAEPFSFSPERKRV